MVSAGGVQDAWALCQERGKRGPSLTARELLLVD